MATTIKAKKIVRAMKLADVQKRDNHEKLVFRRTPLLTFLRRASKSIDFKGTGGAIRWSRDAVTLIGTALEKRLHDVFSNASKVVTFSEKQTVNNKSLLFAMEVSKDSPSSMFDFEKTLDIEFAFRRVLSDAAIDRIKEQIGAARVSRSELSGSMRNIGTNFLLNVVADCKAINSASPRSTVNAQLAAMAVGMTVAGFRKTHVALKAKPVEPKPVPATKESVAPMVTEEPAVVPTTTEEPKPVPVTEESVAPMVTEEPAVVPTATEEPAAPMVIEEPKPVPATEDPMPVDPANAQ